MTGWLGVNTNLDEVGILNERLTRRYDPAMAWNEAINRAIERKKAAREEIHEPHMGAFARQKQTTTNALRNA